MRPRLLPGAVLVLLLGIVACGGSADGGGAGSTPDERQLFVPGGSGRPASSVPIDTDWVYWLSDVDIAVIAGAHPEIAVIDYSQDGGADTEFASAEIDILRSGMSGEKLAISYMSIGEAEDYRYYWQDSWKADRPAWLEQENSNWPGNYKVRFWDPEWQRVIFGTPDSYLDKIMAAGFDGVYLDIIDAYDYFTERDRGSAEDEMVEFVIAISEYAKQKKPGFLVFPQNAPELGARSDYMAAVDGIGVEGVYFGWDAPNVATSAEDTEWLEEQLARFVAAGKTVLTVDYASGEDDVAEAYRRARAQGFSSTVTDVDLGRLPSRAP